MFLLTFQEISGKEELLQLLSAEAGQSGRTEREALVKESLISDLEGFKL